MEIISIITSSGEEVIGELVSSDDISIKIKTPMVLSNGGNYTIMYPLSEVMEENQIINMNKMSMVGSFVLIDKFAQLYRERTKAYYELRRSTEAARNQEIEEISAMEERGNKVLN